MHPTPATPRVPPAYPKRPRGLTRLALAASLTAALSAAPREPLPDRVTPSWPDALVPLPPAAVRLDGFLGLRSANNAANRLAQVDTAPLLAGFQHRPGSHPWIGEHLGKWLHAATLAWSYTGDEQLEGKLQTTVRALLECQEADGYLGTYLPDQRFGLYPGADWDVWVHKYVLLGLLTYHQYTGDEPSLQACRRVGDLLVRTFGPGQKSILAAGTHVGMAATSVLEPMVLLYRATGEDRYLDFSRYLVGAWDEPGGPRLASTLLRERSVDRTANAKAYEMLSNLVGLCELARTTGDGTLLQPALIAWQDVVDHHLYLTGSASQSEHFHAPHDLPNSPGSNVAETCVTTTWIQLNAQLLRLTGEARFGDELEKTFINHLAAAQRPDGTEWCYFTPLEGTKPYGPGINCCVSSGPRGMALVPLNAVFRQTGPEPETETIVLNLLEPLQAGFRLGNQDLLLEETGATGSPGSLDLVLHCDEPARFALRIRTPGWAQPLRLETAVPGPPARTDHGWTLLPARLWKEGDRVSLRYRLAGRLVRGEHTNSGRAALTWGPAVLAYDEALNPDLGAYRNIALAHPVQDPPVRLADPSDFEAVFTATVRLRNRPGTYPARFVLFADAGSQGSPYQVWLRGPDSPFPTNLSAFASGRESRSAPGNVAGSINDGESDTFVVTYNAQPQTQAWFALELDQPVPFRRVRFAHGRTFHDGGWFDTSSGRPRLEIRAAPHQPWSAIATLDSYPDTTATHAGSLREGQWFEITLPSPVQAAALRIVGTPAHGDDPRQAFASCAELEALPLP